MYEPQVNDYVEWTTQLGQVHEGWIYFKADPCIQKRGWPKQNRYLTIEVGIKEKPDYREDNPHKYVHILLCCYEHQWKELRYVKTRKSRTDNTEVDTNYYPDYKSQEGRYLDIQ